MARQEQAEPNFVGYVMFAINAGSLAEAQEKAAKMAGDAPVFQVASSLRELPSPVHLADAERAYGAIGAGGKLAPEDRVEGEWAPEEGD